MQLIALQLKINNCTRLDDAKCLTQGVILGFLDSLRHSLFYCENRIPPPPQILSSIANGEKRLLASSCPSVRPSAWANSALTGRIFTIFHIWVLLEKPTEKIQVALTSGKNNGYFAW